MDKSIIKKIVLDLGKKQVELTPEQARKLKEALDEMFGQKVVRIEDHHHYHDRWYWRPYWYCDTYISKPDNTGIVWTSGNSNTSAMYSNETMTLKLTG